MKPGRRQFIQIFDNRTLQRCRQLSKQLICGQVKIVQFLRKGITKLDKETRQTILIIPFSFKIEIYCRYIVQKEHIYVSICIGHIWKSLSGSGLQGVGLVRNCSVLVMGGSRQLKTNLNNLLSAKPADSLGCTQYFCSNIFTVAQRRNKTEKACKSNGGDGWKETSLRLWLETHCSKGALRITGEVPEEPWSMGDLCWGADIAEGLWLWTALFRAGMALRVFLRGW